MVCIVSLTVLFGSPSCLHAHNSVQVHDPNFSIFDVKLLCRGMINAIGLFILVALLSYGLVEVPRHLWNKGNVMGLFRFHQFRVAVQSDALQSARRRLEETLELVYSTDAQLRQVMATCTCAMATCFEPPSSSSVLGVKSLLSESCLSCSMLALPQCIRSPFASRVALFPGHEDI